MVSSSLFLCSSRCSPAFSHPLSGEDRTSDGAVARTPGGHPIAWGQSPPLLEDRSKAKQETAGMLAFA